MPNYLSPLSASSLPPRASPAPPRATGAPCPPRPKNPPKPEKQPRPRGDAFFFDDLIRLDPDDADAHLGLGTPCAPRELKRYPEAEAAYRNAAAFEQRNAGAPARLGDVLRELRRHPEAEAAYREAIRRDPGNAGALAGLENVLRDMKRD